MNKPLEIRQRKKSPQLFRCEEERGPGAYRDKKKDLIFDLADKLQILMIRKPHLKTQVFTVVFCGDKARRIASALFAYFLFFSVSLAV